MFYIVSLQLIIDSKLDEEKYTTYRNDELDAIRLQANMMKMKMKTVSDLIKLKLLKKCWSKLYFGNVYR